MPCSPVRELKNMNNGLDRVYSEETDDSPFGSSLVTPDGEDAYNNSGIHERLENTKSFFGYFDSKEILHESTKDPSELAGDIVDISIPDNGGLEEVMGKEVEMTHVTQLNQVLMMDDQVQGPPLVHSKSNNESNKSLESPVLSSSSSSSSSEYIGNNGLGNLYSLPNDHINTDVQSIDAKISSEISQSEETRPLIDSDSIPVFRENDLGTKFWAKEFGPAISSLTCRALVSIMIRLVCFLPWCITVGGALLLSPEHLDLLAFRTGYLEGLSGIKRFAHWAEYGFQHIAAFLSFLGILTWMAPTAGLLCIGGLLAQFCWAWHSFLVDRNIPLGEDDRQTVYLLATTTWLNDTIINMRKIGDSYYATEVKDKGKDIILDEGKSD